MKINLGKIMLYGKRVFPVYNALVLTLLFFGVKPVGMVLGGIGIFLIIFVYFDRRRFLGQEHDEILDRTEGYQRLFRNQEMIKAELGIEPDIPDIIVEGKLSSELREELKKPVSFTLLASQQRIVEGEEDEESD